MTLTTRSDVTPLDALGTVRLALRQFGFLGATARYLLLRDELRRFVKRGQGAAAQAQRRHILDRFAAIHAAVPCAHSPLQFAIIADHLLALDVPGDIVECGAFKGGSTAKLSVLAGLTGRRLIVCDSSRASRAPRRARSGTSPSAISPTTSLARASTRARSTRCAPT